MTKYKPNYSDLNKVPDKITPSGKISRELISIEEATQRAIAEHPEWLLARKLNSVRGEYIRGDSKPELETLGFKVTGVADDDLFYKVQAPEEWSKSTNGYWTTVVDTEKQERITQFHKGAIYDRDAFLNIIK